MIGARICSGSVGAMVKFLGMLDSWVDWAGLPEDDIRLGERPLDIAIEQQKRNHD